MPVSVSPESPEGQYSPQPALATGLVATMLAPDTGRCRACQTALAIDQRYCVECGERRGSPRFTLAQADGDQSGSVSPGAASAAGRQGGVVTRVQLMLALLVVLAAVAVGALIGAGNAATVSASAKSSSHRAGRTTSTSFFSNGGG